MASFDDYVEAVRAGAKELLKDTLKRGGAEAGEIFEAHLLKSEERLRRWTNLLAAGEITEFEFKLLINNQISLGKMRLRTIKVIGKKSAIVFRDRLRALFIDTALNMLL